MLQYSNLQIAIDAFSQFLSLYKESEIPPPPISFICISWFQARNFWVLELPNLCYKLYLTMGRSPGDEMIVSYNDTVLRRADLDILSGPHYLNDRIIEFYFSYLSTRNPSNDILLVPPSIAFWLQNCADKDSLRAFVEPLNLPCKNLVIFPVNNNEDVTQAEAGSHWSLLAFYRNANLLVHHDSLGGLNSAYSKKLYKSVLEFMGSSDSNTKYTEHKSSPQQRNGYDCGLFVTAIASTICSWYTSSDRVDDEHLWFSNVVEQVTPSTVTNMRTEILDLIRGLMSAKP